MPITFGEKLLIEQIRSIEEAGSIPVTKHQACTKSANFEQCLIERAQSISNRDNVHSSITHAAKLSKWLLSGFVFLSACAGGLAVLQAIESSNTTLNIYWLIIVLLGVNFISLILWIVSVIVLRRNSSNYGVIGTLWHWIEPHIVHKNPTWAAADKAWFSMCHHGAMGRWRLSGLTHGLWLTYLLAGFFILLVSLMTRQYDFVWATTILSSDVFLTLTQTLASPLQWLGITTPSLEQIEKSYHAISQNAQVELRKAWAMFLLGGLFVYGILPRLVLLLLSKIMETIAKQQFQLDLTQPYYIKLHQELMPGSTRGKIVDPDAKNTTSTINSYTDIGSDPIPDQALWVAVELTTSLHWPPNNVRNNLGHITDSDTLAQVMKHLENNHMPLIIAVSINRLPDRGLKRILIKLYATTEAKNRWLTIISSNDIDNDLKKDRLNNWHSIAEDCDIPERHLSIIQDDKT